MMGPCEPYREKIVSFLRDELDGQDLSALEDHLRSCPDCLQEKEALRRVWSVLGRPEPRPELRAGTLQAVSASHLRETRRRSARQIALRWVPPGVAAALASFLLIGAETRCRSVLEMACCCALWAGVYLVAFTLIGWKRGRTPLRHVAIRSLAAGASGLFLARYCPIESGEASFLPLLSRLASSSAVSFSAAFGFGIVLAAIPLLASMLVAPMPATGRGMGTGMAGSGIYFGLIAPGLFMLSSTLALGALLLLLAGAALGAVIPAVFEVLLRGATPEEA